MQVGKTVLHVHYSGHQWRKSFESRKFYFEDNLEKAVHQ